MRIVQKRALKVSERGRFAASLYTRGNRGGGVVVRCCHPRFKTIASLSNADMIPLNLTICLMDMEEGMTKIPGNVEWIGKLIPGIESRVAPFVVDTDEVDDELVEVFMEEIRRLAGELRQGLSTDDSEMVRMAAHSIKGMGGTLGLPEISVLGLEVENMAKEARLNEAEPLVAGLEHWMSTLD